MKNKCIAITGYRGVIGRKFIEKYKKNKFELCKIDISNRRKVFNWIKNTNFEIFIHLAAVLDKKNIHSNKIRVLKTNFNGTKNIIDALNKYKKNKIWFFFASSSHVYSFSQKKIHEKSRIDPINYYGQTKLLAEKYIKKNLISKNFNLCIGRIFNLSDVNQKKNYFIPYIYSKIKGKSKLIFRGLNKKRDFIHVNDILNAIKILYINKKIGIYNIGSGKPIFLYDIVKRIYKKQNCKNQIYFLNNKRGGDLICDNKKLKKIGWKVNHSFEKILSQFN